MMSPYTPPPGASMLGGAMPGLPQPWTYILKRQSGKDDDGPRRGPFMSSAPSGPQAYYVEPFPDYVVEGRVYGDAVTTADRILKTYQDRESGTGVLLVGDAGAGKTMMMKIISQRARERLQIPTVIVNEPFYGDDFNLFVCRTLPPCVLIFDEFEKVYRGWAVQEAMLTLYDGLFSSKKLLVHTANDLNAINTHYLNRPGRIYYCIKYKGLDSKFVREYCQENLEDTQYIPDICRIVALHRSFNFDMLKALVEEMNRYHEPPRQALKILNVTPGSDLSYRISVKLADGRLLPPRWVFPPYIDGNPMVKESLRITWQDRNDAQGANGVIDIKPSPETLFLDQSGRSYTHRTDEGLTVIFERTDEETADDPLGALGIS